MDDELLVSWAGRSPEERESIMKVTDPETVRLITANMRLLWTAEIQARQCGVRGLVHPFDQTQLPLLSTMEFDHSSKEGVQNSSLVKWPKVFYEDPMVLPSVLRCVLPAPGAARRAPKVLRPQRWPQLLQPPAKSWLDFEKQLAQLVEQLVLSAQDSGHRSSGSRSEPSAAGTAGAVGSSAVGAAVAAGAAGAPGAEAEEADEALGQRVPGAARAAKRARQRERRRMGKAHGAAAAEGADGEIAAEDELAATQPLAQEVAPAAAAAAAAAAAPEAPQDLPAVRVAGSSGGSRQEAPRGSQEAGGSWRGSHEAGGSRRASLEAEGNVLSILRAQVEQLALSFAGGASSSSSKLGMSTRRGASPMKLEFEPRGGLGAEGGRPKLAEAGRPKPAEAGQSPKDGAGLQSLAADFGQGARGVGRGRPMGADHQLPWHSPHGRGVGRGRALVPPPGLQGLQLDRSQSQKIPHGLAQPWMPGPSIPEDDDESSSPLRAPAPPPGPWLSSLELPADILGHSGERTPSYWASYAPTPVAGYEQTPSPPSSPAPYGLQMPAMGPLAAGPMPPFGCGAVAGRAAAELPAYLPGVIPMYVTVPIAMAHCCPHCGKHFALPPGQEADAGFAGHEAAVAGEAEEDEEDEDEEEEEELLG